MNSELSIEVLKIVAEEAMRKPAGIGDRLLISNSESYAASAYLRFLNSCVAVFKPKVVVECGVYMATATRHMALGCFGSAVIGIDKSFHPAAESNVEDLGNVKLVTGLTTSRETLSIVEEACHIRQSGIELLFIDSTHDGLTPKAEFEAYYPMMARECIVACDDIYGSDDCREAMQEFWNWLPGEKIELNYLHSNMYPCYPEPGFGVAIVRKLHDYKAYGFDYPTA